MQRTRWQAECACDPSLRSLRVGPGLDCVASTRVDVLIAAGERERETGRERERERERQGERWEREGERWEREGEGGREREGGRDRDRERERYIYI